MTLKLTEEEVCEAVEAYWGRRKTSSPIIVNNFSTTEIEPISHDSELRFFYFDYETR